MNNIFEHIGEKSEDVYYIFNYDDYTFVYLSAAFKSLCEVSAEKIYEDPGLLLKAIHPDDKIYVKNCFKDALAANREHQYEFRIIASDAVKYVQLTVNCFYENGKRMLAGIARDISVLRNNIDYAEKINERKNSTLIILAHDLKEPISVINMMATAIESGVKHDEKALAFVQVIKDLCKNNIELIGHVLKQEFLESAGVALHKERVDIVWSMNDVVENYKRSAKTLGRRFTLTSSVKKIYIKVDNLKLMQVFNNLLSNAIKFTQDDGLIEIDISDKRTHVLITVRDNGIGIPDVLQPFLFDKYTRAGRVGLNGEETTGLGMSIIKSLIDLHKGKIWFESEENNGTTFYIELPKLL